MVVSRSSPKMNSKGMFHLESFIQGSPRSFTTFVCRALLVLNKVCFMGYNWTSVKIDKNEKILNIHTDILCILSPAVLCWWLPEELSSEQPMLLQTSPCIFSQSSLQPAFVWSTPSSDAVSTVHINMRNYQSIYIPVYLHSENKVQKLSLGC